MRRHTRGSHRRFKHQEFDRLEGLCPFCRIEMTRKQNRPNSVTFDHIKALSRGGANDVSNGQVMCATCNGLKGGYPMEVFVALRFWELPPRVLKLWKTQWYVSRTGNHLTMQAMKTMCVLC